jgi:glycosyltransferase involved in cell wall biosynthesis
MRRFNFPKCQARPKGRICRGAMRLAMTINRKLLNKYPQKIFMEETLYSLKMKRLLFIITGLSTGGAEMMLLKLLERISRARFSPAVITLTAPGELADRIRTLDIPVTSAGFTRGVFSPLAFCRLVARIREMKPDIVQTWMYHADLIGGEAARLAGMQKVVWCLRNSDLSKGKTKISTRLTARLCAFLSPLIPRHIISCSDNALRLHGAMGYETEKMSVIPNGFDLSRFRPDGKARQRIRTELAISEDTPLIGLIGRFDSQKNHLGFFEAAGLLHKRFPNSHFLLAGTDVDCRNDMLQKAMTKNRVNKHTHLLGLRTDIPEIMAALDILVSASSHGEAFPNVLGEAMASGVPCAVTDVGDSAFIVGNTGKVVKVGDMPGLADAIASLVSLSPAERALLGRRARDRVAECFEIGQVVRQYEDFYAKL